MTDEQFKVNLKPTMYTKGLKGKLSGQVDYVNANINRGELQEGINMINTMISNLTYHKEQIQQGIENQEKSRERDRKHKETLDNIKERSL